MNFLVRALTALVICLAFAGDAKALKPGASEIFTLTNGTLASTCTDNTVVKGGTPLSCVATLPSQVAVSGSQITLEEQPSASVPSVVDRLVRDSTINRLRFGDGTRAQIVDTSAVNAKPYLACNGTTDDRAALNTLVNSGDCAGKDCIIPAGCTILLSSPGAAGVAVTLAQGTQLICEDRVASTFLLARHYCSGGSQPGSYGDTTNTCRSGTLTCDAGSGDGCEFAPTPGSTYTVFGSIAASSKPAVIGCKIDERQIEAYGRCAGGSQSGKACSTADTNATTGCPSSACTSTPLEPSGDGKITAIDLSLSFDGLVDDAEVYNAKISDFVVRMLTGTVRHLQVDSYDTNGASVVPTFTSLLSLLTANGAAVFDSTFGRGVVGVDGGSSSAIVHANRFTNTTSGIAGTGKVSAVGNKIAALSGGGGTCITTGGGSEVSANNLTGCATGLNLGQSSRATGNTISATRFGVVGPSTNGSIGDSQVVGNVIDTFVNTGVTLGFRSQVVGNYFYAGATRDTATSPNTPSTAIGVQSIQNIIANNYFTSASGPIGSPTTTFYGIHALAQPASSFNLGIWNNRFAVGPIGPAIVTGGAGWHINDNYFNQTMGGWCSDSTATNYLSPCTCTTKQCKTGTELGKNCTVDGDCASGTCSTSPVIDTTIDNPYGKYGAQAGTCFATGLNSGGTCDSTTTKADCTFSPIIQIGEDGAMPGGTVYTSTHPGFVYGHGFGSTGAHNKIEGVILARGVGQTDIRFGDSKICGGAFVPTCRGSGGNTGAGCSSDADCTSTGCIWGTGNCCGMSSKLCSTSSDCQTLGQQCNSLGGTLGATCTTDANCGSVSGACQTNTTSCAGATHSDTSITSSYFFPGYQALDLNVTNAQITGLTLNDNTFDASVRGVKFPTAASKLTNSVVQGNRFNLAVASSGSELENWVATMGQAMGNLGLSGGEHTTFEVYLKNRQGGVLSVGYAVEPLTVTADLGVKLAVASTTQKAVGVVAQDVASVTDAPVRVVTAGVTDCYVSGSVTRGDRLKVDAAADGNLQSAGDSDPALARALATRSGAGLVKCLIQPMSIVVTSSTTGLTLTGSPGMIGSATRYMIFGRVDNATSISAESGARQVFPAGTISKMQCATGAIASGKSRSFTVYKGGSAQTMTCTASGTATTCADTTHSVTVATGDTISVESAASGAPAAADVLCAFTYAVTGL